MGVFVAVLLQNFVVR